MTLKPPQTASCIILLYGDTARASDHPTTTQEQSLTTVTRRTQWHNRLPAQAPQRGVQHSNAGPIRLQTSFNSRTLSFTKQSHAESPPNYKTAQHALRCGSRLLASTPPQKSRINARRTKKRYSAKTPPTLPYHTTTVTASEQDLSTSTPALFPPPRAPYL